MSLLEKRDKVLFVLINYFEIDKENCWKKIHY